MPIHIKKIGFALLTLFIILAGFYRSLEQDYAPVKRVVPPLENHAVEKNQCLVHESFWKSKAKSRYDFLEALKNDWGGHSAIDSVRMTDDLWEIRLRLESEDQLADLPGWFLEKADLIQLQSCRPGTGCVYKCCLFL